MKRSFGKLNDGREASLYTITNGKGMTVCLTDLGATLVKVLVPDKDGKETDVILGYDTAQEYLDNGFYFGAVIGRNGNRIDKARFTIDGKTYQLAVNDNENNLHSGPDGFDSRIWEVKSCAENAVVFALESPDGDEGFPGNMHAEVAYTVLDDNTLELCYTAESDADTVANMTNHVYFNLGGHDSGSILDHELKLATEYYTPVIDEQAIPTGEVASVKGTVMDFSAGRRIGQDIDADFDQLRYTGGYDHNFALSAKAGEMKPMALARCKKTGIVMEGFTDCPGVQFYAGNFITPHTGKGGAKYDKRFGFCLESQYYPNAINQEGFDSPLLKAGQTRRSVTRYRFSAE